VGLRLSGELAVRLEKVSRFRWLLFMLVYMFIATIIIAAYASIFRPFWIDEAIHFALGGEPSLVALLHRLNNPDAGFLTRQTGFYQIINYLTLDTVGASFLALRLPSIMSAFLLLWAAYVFLDQRRVSPLFQILGLVAIAGQQTLMYFAGEARPYMPLAATSMGILAFYSSSHRAQGQRSIQILGVASMFLGALFHLYFLIVLPILLVYSVWFRFFIGRVRPDWGSLRRVIHPTLAGSSVVLALIVGSFTWMRPQDTNQLDPFAWIGGTADDLYQTLLRTHLEFLDASGLRTGFMLALSLTFLFLLASGRFRQHRQFFASVMLFFVAFATTFVISMSSVVNNYALAPRQWVVGMAIVPVASVWMIWLATQYGKQVHIQIRSLIPGTLIGVVIAVGTVEFRYIFPGTPLIPIIALFMVIAFLLLLGSHSLFIQMAGVAGLVAFGVSVITLSIHSRVPPLWAVVVVSVMTATFVAIWARSQLQIAPSLYPLLMCFVITFFASVGISQLSERLWTVQYEYEQFVELQLLDTELPLASEIQPAEVDWDSLGRLYPQYGPAWVFVSNLNAIKGGPVWQVFGSLARAGS